MDFQKIRNKDPHPLDPLEPSVTAIPLDEAMLSPTSSRGENDSTDEGTPIFCTSVGSLTPPASVSPKAVRLTPASRKLSKALGLSPEPNNSPCVTEVSVSPVDTVWRDSPMPSRRQACQSPEAEDMLENSPHATPVAHAVLSPKSKAKAERRMQRLLRDKKVAIAFELDLDLSGFAEEKEKVGTAGVMTKGPVEPAEVETETETAEVAVQEAVNEEEEGESEAGLPANDRGACLLHRQRVSSLLIPMSPPPLSHSKSMTEPAIRSAFSRTLQVTAIVFAIFAATSYLQHVRTERTTTRSFGLDAVSVQTSEAAEEQEPVKTLPLSYNSSIQMQMKPVSVQTNSFFLAPQLSITVQPVSAACIETESTGGDIDVSTQAPRKLRQRVAGVTVNAQRQQVQRFYGKSTSRRLVKTGKDIAGPAKQDITIQPSRDVMGGWHKNEILQADEKAKRERIHDIVSEMRSTAALLIKVPEEMRQRPTQSSYLRLPGELDQAAEANLLIPSFPPVISAPAAIDVGAALLSPLPLSCFYRPSVPFMDNPAVLGSLRQPWTARLSSPASFEELAKPKIWTTSIRSESNQALNQFTTYDTFSRGKKQVEDAFHVSPALLSSEGRPSVEADAVVEVFIQSTAKLSVSELSVKFIEAKIEHRHGAASSSHDALHLVIPVHPVLKDAALLRYKRQYQGPVPMNHSLLTHTGNILGHIEQFDSHMMRDKGIVVFVDSPAAETLNVKLLSVENVKPLRPLPIPASYHGKVQYIGDQTVALPLPSTPSKALQIMYEAAQHYQLQSGHLHRTAETQVRQVGTLGLHHGPGRSMEMILKAFQMSEETDEQVAESTTVLALVPMVCMILHALPAVPVLALLGAMKRICT